MWRRSTARVGNSELENYDSDQSISEEEEGLGSEWIGNTISLGEQKNDMGAMKLLSQLEILRESREVHLSEKDPISSHVEKGYHIEEEIEIPTPNGGDDSSHCHMTVSATHPHSNDGMIHLPSAASLSYTDEEIVSDEEMQKINPPALRSAGDNIGGAWSEASRQVEAFVRSNDKSVCFADHGISVKERKSSRGGGGRTKAKPKFLFNSHSDKKDLSSLGGDSNQRISSDNIHPADEIVATDDDYMANFKAETWLNFHDKEYKQPGNHIVPFELANKHDSKGCSMAEFLNCILERNDHPGISEGEIRKKRRKVHVVLKRNVSDITLDDDDLPESLDKESPVQSDNDEENAESVKSIIPKTMADQFHEAFGTASVIDDRLHVAFPGFLCNGLYSRLQKVMQSKKEKDIYSLKGASAETGFKDEEMSILVRILSRSLEAKMIVCSCSSAGNEKNSYRENDLDMKMKDIARTLTIIFNPRACSDVDLEVGNLIRIHTPWKEVQVKDEVIYLCSYFTQALP